MGRLLTESAKPVISIYPITARGPLLVGTRTKAAVNLPNDLVLVEKRGRQGSKASRSRPTVLASAQYIGTGAFVGSRRTTTSQSLN
jgi:hypothetical protein